MDDNIRLAEQARQGDPRAFAALYGQIYQDLYRFALYTLKNAHDAEDVVSDTVTDAYASIRRLRSAEAFRSWIFRILSNKCRRKLKEYVFRTEELPDDLSSAGGGDPAEHLEVRKAFSGLEEEERLIISLHLFGGYKSREIAEMLQMNENTVRSKESRALKKMSRMLEEKEVRKNG
jgi:RNA polymerase sigma factor (sigma-70 family)